MYILQNFEGKYNSNIHMAVRKMGSLMGRSCSKSKPLSNKGFFFLRYSLDDASCLKNIVIQMIPRPVRLKTFLHSFFYLCVCCKGQ
ncbi:hypothetical protein XELAEV_18009634mg [Xenopus laevis]|uniref:Uncharacterized protein n=1 Tax=Xenopus laevis TaxID=8355 RepID=A0A974DU00_XENLA|nr:hypothetical protein XELAEV_18009634mg [Xenopus laevis]